MKTVSTKPTKRIPESDEALQFVANGRRGDATPNLRERLKAFYLRHPLRTLKRGERSIVESLKADRDRR
jgi:hypothetical protein